jgi:anthranilate synthase component 1
MDTEAETENARISPLEAYARLRGAKSFLLESLEWGRLGRHSLLGTGGRVVGFEEAERQVSAGGAVVGYLGYDHVAHLEPVPLPAVGPPWPESAFLIADELLRIDHRAGTTDVVVGDRDAVTARIARPAAAEPLRRGPVPAGGTKRFPDAATYRESVVRAKEHIRAGDVFQIVLSQRAERATSATALEIYASLRRINPSPYMFLLELDEVSLIGSSPEAMVKLEGRRASLNPIAGTAGVGSGDADRLLDSEKDRAEHVMLVDLARNDLSRVCGTGTVSVERLMQPERFSHVTHLVSEVTGELPEGVSPFDLVRACFPAGTVSGAPKVRAMQLISDIEGYRRGIYAGAVGYALPDRTLDTCIAIRMIVLSEGVAHMQAGAGIVADSDPEMEHQECLRKLAAMEAAVDQAEANTGDAER